MTIDKEVTYTPGSDADANNKKVLIIGGTSGLGRAIANRLAKIGAKVTVVGRRLEQSDDEQKENVLEFIQADLETIAAARKLAQSINPMDFDIVVFTVGILAARQRQETVEGLERDMAVSYLNRVAIIEEWLPLIKKSKDHKIRLFIMGFPGGGLEAEDDDLNQEKNYGFMKAHANTVVGNESLVLYLSTIADSNLRVYGLNPGIARTKIRDNLLGSQSWVSWFIESLVWIFTKTPQQYAERIVPTLLSSDLDAYNGKFFDDWGRPLVKSKNLDLSRANKIVENSRELITTKCGPPSIT